MVLHQTYLLEQLMSHLLCCKSLILHNVLHQESLLMKSEEITCRFREVIIRVQLLSTI